MKKDNMFEFNKLSENLTNFSDFLAKHNINPVEAAGYLKTLMLLDMYSYNNLSEGELAGYLDEIEESSVEIFNSIDIENNDAFKIIVTLLNIIETISDMQEKAIKEELENAETGKKTNKAKASKGSSNVIDFSSLSHGIINNKDN
jgi:hypothetical protein